MTSRLDLTHEDPNTFPTLAKSVRQSGCGDHTFVEGIFPSGSLSLDHIYLAMESIDPGRLQREFYTCTKCCFRLVLPKDWTPQRMLEASK